ncbi:MAG: class I SAM-dependent methyltransferase [Polyangiaceae bacterium]|nr:class I SAM-dependent methyltransferase [Polyangiaceae bacterium]
MTTIDLAISRTAARYVRATARPVDRYFTRNKLRCDPVTRALAELGPFGHVLDIGCGRGQLAIFLLEAGLARRAFGVDWDAEKVALANRAASGLAATFETADVAAAAFPPADTVLLVDVLHYFAIDKQDALLARAATCVRPGGRLIVREASSACGARSIFTLAVERISQALRFNVGERIVLRDVRRELVPPLEARGLPCTFAPCWQGTPFSNLIVIATRPPAANDLEA